MRRFVSRWAPMPNFLRHRNFAGLTVVHKLSTHLQKLVSTLNNGNIASSTEVVVAPPAIHISTFQGKLRKDIGVSAQDAFPSTGAHTGETPVSLLKDMGIKYTLVGHSERRFVMFTRCENCIFRRRSSAASGRLAADRSARRTRNHVTHPQAEG